MLAVAQFDLHLPLHFEERGQLVACFHERRGDVEPAHVALEALRDIARGAAQPAADVENVLTGLDRESIREFNSCGKTTRMKMVNRS